MARPAVLPAGFFERPADRVARQLLGKLLVATTAKGMHHASFLSYIIMVACHVDRERGCRQGSIKTAFCLGSGGALHGGSGGHLRTRCAKLRALRKPAWFVDPEKT